ncbi:hypothetical protein NB559_12800 [Vibrio parahaemolyticus]|uniref:hypothetical protein n=1 Tax=Vibrio parahaemolyticus TaxID=670 RepID=UPI001B8231B1|nr:hypothetical protein [Vibrio parahaemolyticus]EJE4157351.1 hypothetical protein [Vibrio parahaemolyticus]MCR9650726.1 hypothetical protein [Vibrio parahaemolyticus]MCR9806358.1 hypothetical protein [Vibrio parahaemolyticus]HBC3821554.1 hypothetical protein [Vibrio parahaemolyticus]
MSNKKLLSELFDELEKIVKIDASYFEELIKCGVNENEAWLRAMARYFLNIDGSYESISIIRDVIYDEYYLKSYKEHSKHFETHGEYLLDNVEKKTIQTLKKLNMNYKIDSEIFNSFSDEDLKSELERRERAVSQGPDIDFDDGLDIEVQDLDLKLLSDDDLDLDDLDFDDDDLDFDDEETELKKDELSDFEVNEAETSSENLNTTAHESFNATLDINDLNISKSKKKRLFDLFKINGSSVKFAHYREEYVNDDIIELINSLDKPYDNLDLTINIYDEELTYDYFDTDVIIHILRYFRDKNTKAHYNTYISLIADNYKDDIRTFIIYLMYLNEYYAGDYQEPFKIVHKEVRDAIGLGNTDWNRKIIDSLIAKKYLKTHKRRFKTEYAITELGYDIMSRHI